MRAALSHHVQVAVAGARIRAHARGSSTGSIARRAAARSSSRSSSVGGGPSRRPARRPRASKGRGELGERREPADGARGHRVVSLAPARRRAAQRPGLGALADDPRVGDSRVARSPWRMKSHLRPIDSTRSTRALGQGDREHQARESRRPRRRRRSSRLAQRRPPRGRSGSRRRGRATRAAGSRTEVGAARVGGQQVEHPAERLHAPVGAARSRRLDRRSIADQGRDDHAALGLLALAERLDARRDP